MNTNAWVRITETLAQTWRTWALWYRGDQSATEPPLHEFAKGILQHAVDWPYAFNAYKLATIDAKEWRLGSIHHISEAQLQEGYTVYPNEWKVVGAWYWANGDLVCRRTAAYPWDPAEALLFMPDECADPPDCTNMVPATKVRDVSLLAGQPPRELN